jgi:Leucine-rich repeat (LRR) protein
MPLERAQVEKNLAGLARSPDNLCHVFTDLALPEQNIDSIEVLEEFPHIQNLDLRGNKLSNLSPLAALPHLLTLDGSQNNIDSVLDFEQPHCKQGDAWCTGDKNVGSTLQEADLSTNIIREIRDLSAHKYLRKLVLDNNQISVIGGIEGLTHLKVLSLRNNNIETIR